MPPQPPMGSTSMYGDAPIPGATQIETQLLNGTSGLRTHSSKFPVSMLTKYALMQINFFFSKETNF